MDKPVSSDSSLINQHVFNAVSVGIVSLMMTCLAITITLFSQKLAPDLQVGFLPLVSFLVSIERIATYKQGKKILVFSKRWFIFQITQWVVILVFLKVTLLVLFRPESLWMEIQLWRLDFGAYFFDTPYILSIIFILTIWMLSGYFAGLLNEMSLEETLIRYETAVMAPVEGPPARERLLGVIFGLGFLLVILTALLRVNMRMLALGEFDQLAIQPLPYLAAGAWNVYLYFLLGLVLMSMSQFARLNARWRFLQIEITSRLAGRWAWYSLSFILLVSLFASLLPTQYSLGLLTVVGYLLKLFYGVLFFVFGFFWALLVFLINQLALLFGVGQPGGEAPPAQVFVPPDLPPEIISSGGDPWWEVVKSVVFWAIFIFVVGFSVVHFARQHQGILAVLQRFAGVSWVSKAWKWLVGGFKGVNQRISEAIDQGLERLRTRREGRSGSGTNRFINLRRLNPRQRVYFFFLAMIRRGSERGIPRKDAQTPYEYADVLENTFPDVDQEVASLTESFVTARYSRSEVDDEQVSRVKRYWERIRGALRSYRR
jgi:hypothetical protein